MSLRQRIPILEVWSNLPVVKMLPEYGSGVLTVNTEDMKKKEPDIIVRAAHALPDQVTKMFNEDFETNDIWKHFDAVKNKRVYDLTYEYFGMSANFKYKKALSELEKIFIRIQKEHRR